MSRHGSTAKGQKNKHGSGGGSKSKGLKDIRIDECVKIAVHLSLERFHFSDQNEMEFPSSLTSTERAFIHRQALSLGYVSKSKGKGSKRFLTIRKKAGLQRVQSCMSVELSSSSMQTVRSLLHRFPVTCKERTDLLPRTASHTSDPPDTDNGRDKNRTNGRLHNGIPQVPQRRSVSELDAFRRSLPVYERQEEIVQIIREHRVVLVVGETGSGKTTQIPQFLLDDSSRKGAPCRIFCTQPRRLATIAVAERVAAERGEAIGQTVGYQIRLESRVSPKTLLTFCTSGVLLRTLMAGDAALATVTHVIVDEVHERDGLTDFLLIKLRDLLQTMPTLRLILSSAALDEQLFLRYFGSCPTIHIKGRPFEVKQLFLEDILRMMGYANKDMIKYKKERQREDKTQKSCSEWREDDEGGGGDDDGHQSPDSCQEDTGDTIINELSEPVDAVVPLEPWLSKEMDSCISNVFHHQDADVFVQLFNLILNENVSVDYTHSETSATALMVAAARGFLTQMEKLITMGANLHLKANNDWAALDWAKHFQQSEAVDLLESYLSMVESGHVDESTLVQRGGAELSPEEQQLLEAYHHSFDDDKVDLDLVLHLLHNICTTSEDGAVLIFLPGYEEIVGLRDRITSCDDKRFSEYARRFQVFTLHSNMQTMDQKKVMRNTPPGVRKIILSTNIAETSITINDVVFVIDSGKVKEKSFDAINHVSMLKMGWISKASALQRKGRAGRCRPGICFHMFSRLRFNSMQEFQVPQLLRMPLQELCLHTKLLAPINCPIADFLARAPEPPPIHIVKNAVHMLKTVDAMEPSEDLTELGYHLADLPVEPHLGKMVLCGVVMKCLDPILTIACTLAHRDPFVLPAQAFEKRASLLCRKRFTAGTFSDHMALLRAFQAWQKACNDGWERSFCEKNFLSQASLEIIVGMRTQLLGQLRAIGFVRARGAGDIRDVNLNSENWSVVKAALVAGMYPNLIHVDRHTCTLSSNKEKKVRFHPTSVLCQPQGQDNKKTPSANGQMASVQALPTDWLIYDEMTRAHRIASVRCCSMVSPVTVTIFGGSARLPASALQEPTVPKDDALNDSSDSEVEERSAEPAHLAQLKIDEWLHFQLDSEIAAQVFQLRQKWHSMFLRRIRFPSKPWSQQDEATLQALVTVLGTEEQAAGIQQPTGIGQRPRPLNSCEMDTSQSSPPVTHRDTTRPPRSDMSSPTHRPSKLSPASGLSLTKLSPASKTKLSPASKQSSRDKALLQSKHTSDRSPASGKSAVRYFVMKSGSLRHIETSQHRGVWSTSSSNQLKLNAAFVHSHAVYLAFSVQGSVYFQGYARMTSEISEERCEDWSSSPSGPGAVFGVEWIRTESLPFQFAQQLLNPWNDNRRVQLSRDGQELEPQVGSQLLQLWEKVYGGQRADGVNPQHSAATFPEDLSALKIH